MNQRERRVVFLGGALVIGAVAWRGGLGQAVAEWGDARARLAAESDRVADLEQQAQRRDAIGLRLQQRFGPAATRPLGAVVEVQADFPAAVREALGGAGLKVASVSVQGVQRVREVSGVSLVRVLVEGTAEGHAVPAVLAGTRSLPRVTRLEEVRLTRNGDNWSLRMVLSTPARRGNSGEERGQG